MKRLGRSARCNPSIVALLLALLAATSASAQSYADEYRVKAAFLFHFAQLVDWPADSLSAVDNSLVLCTLGADSFQGALESTVEGKTAGTRIIRIRHLKQPEEAQGCQILFLGKAQGSRIPLLLANLRSAPILTVGETPGFLGAGGMICFRVENNKVRFDINLDAAESARLKIGSRLLFLAQIVLGGQRK